MKRREPTSDREREQLEELRALYIARFGHDPEDVLTSAVQKKHQERHRRLSNALRGMLTVPPLPDMSHELRDLAEGQKHGKGRVRRRKFFKNTRGDRMTTPNREVVQTILFGSITVYQIEEKRHTGEWRTVAAYATSKPVEFDTENAAAEYAYDHSRYNHVDTRVVKVEF